MGQIESLGNTTSIQIGVNSIETSNDLQLNSNDKQSLSKHTSTSILARIKSKIRKWIQTKPNQTQVIKLYKSKDNTYIIQQNFTQNQNEKRSRRFTIGSIQYTSTKDNTQPEFDTIQIPTSQDNSYSQQQSQEYNDSIKQENNNCAIKIKYIQYHERVCRICKDEESNEKLISPCDCSGSMTWVHNSCLKKWVEYKIDTDNYDRCEICLFKYRILIQTKFSLQNLNEYFQENPKNQRNFLILTLFTLINLILGVFLFYQQDETPNKSYRMSYLVQLGMIIYFIFGFVGIFIIILRMGKDEWVYTKSYKGFTLKILTFIQYNTDSQEREADITDIENQQQQQQQQLETSQQQTDYSQDTDEIQTVNQDIPQIDQDNSLDNYELQENQDVVLQPKDYDYQQNSYWNSSASTEQVDTITHSCETLNGKSLLIH